ncbi:MAG: phage holin family protein [Acidimicrobiia bacterium]|jgi:hypothetical protein
MAGPTELPELITEFVTMAKEYLRQETVEPAKRLGRYAGFSLGAAVAIAFGLLFLSVALVRGMVRLLPDGPNWSALGYLLAALVLVVLIGIIIGLTGREESEEG